MISKETRVFEVEGEKYQFNVEIFKRMFLKFSSEQNIKISQYEQDMADALCVDKATIHNWRNRLNGPSDIEKIQALAKFWNCDYRCLLKRKQEEEKRMDTTGKIGIREKESVKVIFKSLLEFLEEFEDTNAFEYKEGFGIEVDKMYGYKLYKKIIRIIKGESLDLPENVYNAIYEYVTDRLEYLLQGEYCPELGDDEISWHLQVLEMSDETITEFKELVRSYY